MCPRILHIYGPFFVNGYGLMVAIGLLVFLTLTYFSVVRRKILPGDDFLKIATRSFIAAVFGSRLLFVLFESKNIFDGFLHFFRFWDGGLSMFGAVFGVLLTVTISLWMKKISVLKMFDVISLYAPLMEAFSRVGCLLAGCCYGLRASRESLFSIVFTDPNSIAPTGIPLVPTQVYSMLLSLLTFLLLFFISRRGFSVPGVTFFSYLILSSLSRFIMDFFRGDAGELYLYGSLSYMQLIVGFFLVGAVLGLIIVIGRAKGCCFSRCRLSCKIVSLFAQKK